MYIGSEPTDSIQWVGTEAIDKLDLSRRQNTFLLFTADWCGWCRRFENEALTDTAVIRILHESFNAIRVDPGVDSMVVSGDSTLSCRDFCVEVYGVTSFPRLCFIDRWGHFRFEIKGYVDAETFLSILEYARGF